MSFLLGAVSGVASFTTTIVTDNNMPWWATLLISLVPPIIGAILDIGVKRGWFTKDVSDKVKDVVEDVAEDLKDDGKINGSTTDENKGDK